MFKNERKDVRKKNIDLLACLASEDFANLVYRSNNDQKSLSSEEHKYYQLLINTNLISDDIKISKTESLTEIENKLKPSLVIEKIKNKHLRYRKYKNSANLNDITPELEQAHYLWEKIK